MECKTEVEPQEINLEIDKIRQREDEQTRQQSELTVYSRIDFSKIYAERSNLYKIDYRGRHRDVHK